MLVSGSELYPEGERDPLAALGGGHNRVDQNRRKRRREGDRAGRGAHCSPMTAAWLFFFWAPSHPPRDPHASDHRLYPLELVFM